MRNIYILLVILLLSITAKAQLVNDEALAAQYDQVGDFDKALMLYRKLFNKSRDISFYQPFFSCLLRAKKYDEAEQLVKKQIKDYPGENGYAIDLAKIYQQRGDQAKLSEWFNRLSKQTPKTELAVKNLAYGLYKGGFYEYAIKTYVSGRDVLGNRDLFSAELINLYRLRKDKAMLRQEYLNALSHNPAIQIQTQDALASMFDKAEDYDALKTELIKRLQKDPQNVPLSELLIWAFIQQREFIQALRQTLTLDKQLKEEGNRVYNLSKILVSNRAYDQAIDALNDLTSRGTNNAFYSQARVDLLDIKMRRITEQSYTTADLLALEKDYQRLLTELGKRSETAFAIRQLAYLQAYYLHKPNEAKLGLEELLAIPRLTISMIGQLKLELGDIQVVADQLWDAALTYGQVEKQFAGDPLAQEAKIRNARLAYYQGNFAWAKLQLDVLKGATSQLIANDALNLSLLLSDNLQNEADTAAMRKYAQADLFIFKNMPDQALLVLDSIKSSDLTDDILMAKAKIYISKINYTEALAQLKKISSDYATELWADDAIFMMADIMQMKLKQPDQAKDLYQKIIVDFPGSMYIVEARKRFRELRGDKL